VLLPFSITLRPGRPLHDQLVFAVTKAVHNALQGADVPWNAHMQKVYLEKVLEKAGHKGPVKIAQLEGTTGAAPAIERAKGFKEVMDAEHKDDWEIVASQTGDFTRAGGKQVMQAFLQSNPDIDVLFAHNDDMGLGAIEAIEAAGKKPGQDIKIVSIDGTRNAVQGIVDGTINAVIESNPRFGPLAFKTAGDFYAGTGIPADVIISDNQYDSSNASTSGDNCSDTSRPFSSLYF